MELYLWIAILIFSIIVEVATATALVSVWFIAGAIGAIIALLLNASFLIQVIVFISISLLFLIIFRPIALRHVKSNFVPTNADRVIGRQTELLEDITSSKWGEVKIDGVIWNATTIDSSPINKGNLVEVLAIEGSKLIVKKL
ncbi:MAG: NfeD family protein [Erysipelotrichaceae bacterium]|jgi:membrane protein implicated in regulation of membrane protease activity|nr:NfeD family protein [Erysipelotrichaceae bacterium]